MPFRRLVRRAARGLAAGARIAVTTLGAGAGAGDRAGRRPPAKAHGLLGSKPAPRPGSKPPPRGKIAPRAVSKPARQTRKARVQAQKRARKPPAFGALDALGFFLLAGLIVAWPRERSLQEGERGRLRRPATEVPLTAGPEAADRAEPGRGRAARHPFAIPPRGWRDILLRTWTNFNNDRIMATAGGVTFFTLLAIFPALAAFVSLYGLFFDAQNARAQLALISGFVPRDIVIFIGDEMSRIAAGGGGKLGLAFAVSLLLSLWSANGALKALFDGLNVAYEQKETRGIVKVNLLTLAFTIGAIVFALIAIGGVVVAPAVLGFLHLDAGGKWLALLRWPALLLLLALGLSVVYRYGPNRARPSWVWLTPGGLLAAVLWLAASLLFSLYVSSFGSFNKTYGSLGAVVGFMTWLWYSTIIVLFGAELNAELEHQTAVDTTAGRARRPGDRGATMADTLGKAQP